MNHILLYQHRPLTHGFPIFILLLMVVVFVVALYGLPILASAMDKSDSCASGTKGGEERAGSPTQEGTDSP